LDAIGSGHIYKTVASYQAPEFNAKLQFVLVDGRSAAKRKQKTDRKAIQSHIIQEYWRKERLDRTIRHQQATTIQNGRPKIEISRPTSASTTSPRRPETAGTYHAQGPEDAVSFSSTTLRRNFATTEDRAISIPPRQPQECVYFLEFEDSNSDNSSDFSSYPSPTIYLGGGNDDPFSSTIIQLDSRRHSLIGYFLSDCLPSVYVMEDGNHKQWNGSKVLADEVRRCTNDATRCYSTLAMASSFAELSRCKSSGQSDSLYPSQETTYFKWKAVQDLKKSLTRETSSYSLIWSVCMLTASECFIGNVQAQRVHLKGISQHLKFLGGFQCLQPYLRDPVIITDINSAIPVLAQPVFPLCWAPPSLPPSIRDQFLPPEQDNPIRTLNDRFETALKRALIPDGMLEIFRDVRDASLLAKHSIVYGVSQHTDLIWLNYQILAFEHRLLSMTFDMDDTDQAMLNCIRIAMLLYINTTVVDQMPADALQALIPQLQDALHHTNLSATWGQYSDVLLWVLFFGCHIAEGTSEYYWFEAHLANVAIHLHLTEWDDVQELMLEFFYVDCIHDYSFTKIWGNVESLMSASGLNATKMGIVDGNTIDPRLLNTPGLTSRHPQRMLSSATKRTSVGSNVRINAMMLRVSTNCHPRGFQPLTLPKSYTRH